MNKNIPKLFASGPNANYNACINWVTGYDAFILYLDGYKKGADLIVDNVINTNANHDTLIYPAVFLYRHAIEINLKILIQNAYMLLDLKKNHPTHHKIHLLWNELRLKLSELVHLPNKSDLELINKYIKEFQEHDKGSMVFRYSVDKEGKSITPNLDHINFERLKDGMKKLLDVLKNLNYTLCADLNTKREIDKA